MQCMVCAEVLDEAEWELAWEAWRSDSDHPARDPDGPCCPQCGSDCKYVSYNEIENCDQCRDH